MTVGKRIYVGGLAEDVSQADVLGRFTAFGDVLSCEIMQSKDLGADVAACRGFAYVTLVPKDDASLARALSLYNGCKWRGQKLRVELAKPDYMSRLQQEWQQQQAAEQQQQDRNADQQQQQQQQQSQLPADATLSSEAGQDDSNTLRLTVPGLKRKHLTVDLSSKHKSHRSWFPTHKMKPPRELSWDPLPPSKRAAMQEAAAAAVPVLTAEAAEQQVRATQELLHELSRRQELQVQQQRAAQAGEVITQAAAAVPLSYQQKLEEQQQTALLNKKDKKKQKSSQVVQQELMGQLKVLKRIADKEQQQGQLRHTSSTAVVDFMEPLGHVFDRQQQQQQQQSCSQPQQHQHATQRRAGKEQVQSTAPNSPIGVHGSRLQRHGRSDLSKSTNARGAVHPCTAAEPGAAVPRQQGAAGAGGSSDDEEVGSDVPLSSDYASEDWEQWLAAEGLAGSDEPEAAGPGGGGAAGVPGVGSGSAAGATRVTGAGGGAAAGVTGAGARQAAPKGLLVGAGAARRPGGQAAVARAAHGEPQSEQGGTSESEQSEGSDFEKSESDMAGGRAAAATAAGVTSGSNIRLKVAAASSPHNTAAPQRQNTQGMIPNAAGLQQCCDLDRFGSDSEEVLGDVDEAAAISSGPHTHLHKDQLLCPRV